MEPPPRLFHIDVCPRKKMIGPGGDCRERSAVPALPAGRLTPRKSARYFDFLLVFLRNRMFSTSTKNEKNIAK